ncbi:Phosphopantetheine adenylyltransferase [Candidatus Cyrtobacter comes]|uniref:Phosphopantetheine adenylyltransferase n=1 Tax=Candidatus Cyrtobacter comes TaxID=675776 RepID=A0ABU5L7M2_9RICK|nr:pantetheine-phosphate adenylyltransferase [Candidatus Cyrtobacter comes]MDZ5762132.1 Phosphopantetheine adenylyltransferase [Candidatus Cyrtobacter comes]
MKVIYPGTFDPITLGHLDIIKRASRIFSSVTIGVAQDTRKNTIFSLEERVRMIEQEVAHIKNVEVIGFTGLLVDFARKNDVHTMVRGLRAVSDFEYEFQLAYVNRKMNHKIDTVFLPSTEEGHFISSSFAREIARLGGDLSQLVSVNVANMLIAKVHYL